MQRPPAAPQAEGIVPAWQTSALSQQPTGHVDWQVTTPPSPTPPSTGSQRPERQPSPGWHLTQLCPFVPQARVVVLVMHWLFWQQPLGQFDGPHGTWHCPVTQMRLLGRQSVHVAPPTPQAFEAAPPRQTPFWQHPLQLGQAPASAAVPPPEPASAMAHARAVQTPEAQAEHAAPPLPHAAASEPATHFPLASQQP